MKTIYVCIGSACHLKGSYQVIHKLQDLIHKESMESEIEVKAAFCLGECTKAVSVKADDGSIHSVKEETADVFFYEVLLGRK
ncbi:MAG: (2Fe-2S) ferredoxin domain-containing protein [Epulopiscium sp.]|nr:(2Fe-2S) ferredoxin domain-containing protein [Candidatus Epulonipiscium sp.]